jgi:hypothetical protein
MCFHVSRIFGCSFSRGLFDGLGLFSPFPLKRVREKKEKKKKKKETVDTTAKLDL